MFNATAEQFVFFYKSTRPSSLIISLYFVENQNNYSWYYVPDGHWKRFQLQ